VSVPPFPLPFPRFTYLSLRTALCRSFLGPHFLGPPCVIINPCGLFFSPSRCLTGRMQTWGCLHVCLEVTPGTAKMACMAPLGHVSGGTHSHQKPPRPPTERVWGPELHQPASLSTCRLQHPSTPCIMTRLTSFVLCMFHNIHIPRNKASGHFWRHGKVCYP
jgi:hypothetical protein